MSFLVLNSDAINSNDIETEIEELEDYGSAISDEDENKLNMLRRVREEVKSYNSDWRYGVTLIHKRHWIEYAQDLAADTGVIQENLSWPLNCIDWEYAAKELAYDYSTVEIDNETYYFMCN